MPKFSIGYIHCVCLYKIEWDFLTTKASIYIYSTIYRDVFRCSTAHQCTVALYNLDMAWQLSIPKRLTATTACGTIAVMHTSRVCKAIWGQSAQTTTRVVGFALYIYIYIYIYILYIYLW